MRLPVQLRVSLAPFASRDGRDRAAGGCSVRRRFVTPADADRCDRVAAVVLAGWAAPSRSLHGTRTARRAIVEILLSSDAVIVARRRDGELIAGHVRSTYVRASAVHDRSSGVRTARAGRAPIPLVPDMLDARRLPATARAASLRHEGEVTAGRAGEPGLSVDTRAAFGLGLCRQADAGRAAPALRAAEALRALRPDASACAAASGSGRERRR